MNGRTTLSIGYRVAASLVSTALEYGASTAELASIEALQNGEGTSADVRRLERMAVLAGQPWRSMFAGLGVWP